MSLQEKLDAWTKSAKGKQKLKAAFGAAMQSNKNGKLRDINVHDADFYLQKFIEILRDCMDRAGNAKSGYGYSYMAADHCIETSPPEVVPESGEIEVGFSFKPEAIMRDSLFPDYSGDPDHAYDIVALLNRGYSADGQVYGYWSPAGKTIASLQSREGSFFIQTAVEIFNSTYGEFARAYYNETKYE